MKVRAGKNEKRKEGRKGEIWRGRKEVFKAAGKEGTIEWKKRGKGRKTREGKGMEKSKVKRKEGNIGGMVRMEEGKKMEKKDRKKCGRERKLGQGNQNG